MNRAAPEPFFIVGFQRSGTTMLRLMLNAHPDIAIPHDSAELWPSYRDRASQYGELREPDNVTKMVEDLLGEPRIKAWGTRLPKDKLLARPMPTSFAEVMARFHTVYAQEQGKRLWGDKNTGTLTEVDELNALFPGCKFIHLVRDGRDCALSHMSNEYVYGYKNVLRAAIEWKEQVTLCHKMLRMLPAERFLELTYEELVLDPVRQLRGICEFLSIPFSSDMTDFHKTVDKEIPADRRALWPRLDRPPDKSNAFKWQGRLTNSELGIFERHAGLLLKEFRYETRPHLRRKGRLLELWLDMQQRIVWRL